MPSTKTMVILAGSDKEGGYCVAGKVVRGLESGQWIRPVSSSSSGELDLQHIRMDNLEIPKVLDVVRVPIQRRAADLHQTENFLVQEGKHWQFVSSLPVSEVVELCDPADSLWTIGHSSDRGENDIVPEGMLGGNGIQSSLLFIRPTRLVLRRDREWKRAGGKSFRKWTVRASFLFRRTPYCLVVTDPDVKEICRIKDIEEFAIRRRNIFLCVSLAMPTGGYAYKLVASIVNFPRP